MTKVSQVAITLNMLDFTGLERKAYHECGEYLSMFISDWLKAKRLALGDFNRFVFREKVEPTNDLKVVGEKAFAVGIELEYPNVILESVEEVHRYFVRKYLEGFERVDSHFKLQLTPELREAIDRQYASGEYFYEKKIAGKRLDGKSVQLFHHYDCKEYRLVLKVKVGRDQVEEHTLFSGTPDPFIVKFDVNKVEISKDGIEVTNAVRKQTVYFAFGK